MSLFGHVVCFAMWSVLVLWSIFVKVKIFLIFQMVFIFSSYDVFANLFCLFSQFQLQQRVMSAYGYREAYPVFFLFCEFLNQRCKCFVTRLVVFNVPCVSLEVS
jgi:hypothetical protein